VVRFLRGRAGPVVLPFVLAAAFPATLVHVLGAQPVRLSEHVTAAVVGGGGALSVMVAIALSVLGARGDDRRTMIVGIAFTLMGLMQAWDALVAAGVLPGESAGESAAHLVLLPLGAGILALTGLPALRRPGSTMPLVGAQLVVVALVMALVAVTSAVPELAPGAARPGGPVALTALGVGSAFYVILIARALKTFLLTHRRADLVMLTGLGWLTYALATDDLVSETLLGWWLGEALALSGIIFVGVAYACDLRLGCTSSRPLHGDLRGVDLVTHEESFLGAHVRALLVQLERKDVYTEGHARRVALYAVQVGEELGRSPTQLRCLAIGGLLHDIGKLAVPGAILGKREKLTDDEFAVVHRHTLWGADLLAGLGGFSAEVRRLVRDHHERPDGGGYPHRRPGMELTLETLILTVCDVFDALVSERVYREAWSPKQAIALLRREAGTAFDPRCVAALERVLERQDGRHAQVREIARAAAGSSLASGAPCPAAGTAG